jgi:hypothetical protein
VEGSAVNYYDARKRQSDGRWDFTCMNDGEIWPVGYCAQEGGGHHETEAEARECYRDYLLDNELRFRNPADPATLRKCEVAGCGVFTGGSAELSLRTWVLCDAHRNRAEVEKLFGPVGQIMSS